VTPSCSQILWAKLLKSFGQPGQGVEPKGFSVDASKNGSMHEQAGFGCSTYAQQLFIGLWTSMRIAPQPLDPTGQITPASIEVMRRADAPASIPRPGYAQIMWAALLITAGHRR
jgi:hypothetical protein